MVKEDILKELQSLDKLEKYASSLHSGTEGYSFLIIPPSKSNPSAVKTMEMTAERSGLIFVTGKYQVENIIELIAEVLNLKGRIEFAKSLKILKPAAKYHITFDLIIADDKNVKWNIRKALNGTDSF